MAPLPIEIRKISQSEHARTPQLRLNPLTGEWSTLVSPHRIDRPWQGAVETLPPESLPDNDPKCYLCPGNERVEGQRNPDYTSATGFHFENDFKALLHDHPELAGHLIRAGNSDLLQAAIAYGYCDVALLITYMEHINHQNQENKFLKIIFCQL